jgi:NitT/TauT family transport system ATP-binding protein
MGLRERGCLLVIEEVCKSFEDTTRGKATLKVLDRVNLCVRSGQFSCLLGPSGCGKSSLLNIIAGFEQASSGCVLINNREVNRPGSDRGVIFQEDALFPWLTVRENIAYGLIRAGRSKDQIREKVNHFIELVGLEGFSEFYPEQISGGMKQKVALARVLINEPEALLMDEPFAALDALTRSSMQNLLLELWEAIPKTILFVTHDVDEALILAERIYVMTTGPGSILADVEVDLLRPRNLDIKATPAYLAIKRNLVNLLERARSGERPPEILPGCSNPQQ